MRTLLLSVFVADATQKRRSMSQATCFIAPRTAFAFELTGILACKSQNMNLGAVCGYCYGTDDGNNAE